MQESLVSKNKDFYFVSNSDNFKAIPGMPIAYWASENIRYIFEKAIPLKKIASPRQGLATADNNRFLRRWFEVNYNRIKFGARDRKKPTKWSEVGSL